MWVVTQSKVMVFNTATNLTLPGMRVGEYLEVVENFKLNDDNTNHIFKIFVLVGLIHSLIWLIRVDG